MKYFHTFIRNVNIVLWNHYDDSSNIEHFFKTKCSKDLHRIGIVGDVDLKPFFKKLKTFLRNVEVVEFRDRCENSSDDAKFLQFCPNLTKLTLGDKTSRRNTNAVLTQKYRKLKDFNYIDSSLEDLDIDKVKSFFQTNNTIKTVAWRFRYDQSMTYTNAIACLRNVDYVSNLEHLSLTICSYLADSFDEISNYLGSLCERENFQCLELEFVGTKGAEALRLYGNKMVNWKQVTKMHLHSMNFTEVVPTLRSLIHLKIIVLTYVVSELSWHIWFDEDELIDLVDRKRNVELPFIEEVHFKDIGEELLKAFILQFTRHWKKLNKILLPNSSFEEVQLDVSLLNRERRKLENACTVTIFTDHAENATNVEHDLVKLKRAEFVELGAAEADAFQTYYMMP